LRVGDLRWWSIGGCRHWWKAIECDSLW